ncbi:MAG: hypothetical protein ACTSRI_05065 [Promethearchaeota archaeon]
MLNNIGFIDIKDQGGLIYEISLKKDGFYYGVLHHPKRSENFNIKAASIQDLRRKLRDYLILIKGDKIHNIAKNTPELQLKNFF